MSIGSAIRMRKKSKTPRSRAVVEKWRFVGGVVGPGVRGDVEASLESIDMVVSGDKEAFPLSVEGLLEPVAGRIRREVADRLTAMTG